MTEPTQERIDDIKKNFGFTDKEARAFYHLDSARDLFAEIMVDDESPRFAKLLFHQMDAGIMFRHLRRLLGQSVLERQYPDGWGLKPKSDDIEDE